MALRVALVTPFAWSQPHDVNEHVHELARELRRRGHAVTVLAPSSSARDLAAGRRALLERAEPTSTHPRCPLAFANKLLKIWPVVWTFASAEAVEPTNNAAGRALRGPVIHRKLSHGSRSQDGEHFIERALSASVTCRLQGRSLFTYLAELITAHARGDPLPTLA